MRSSPDPSRVRFSGSLLRYVDELATEFARLGYTVLSATELMRFTAHLSCWLEVSCLGLSDVNEGALQGFLAVRRAEYTTHYSMRTLAPILAFLRREGIIPPVRVVESSSEIEVLLAEYRSFLVTDRGLSLPVTEACSRWVAPFVSERYATHPATAMVSLTASDVSGFLAAKLPSMTRKSAQMTACALRSFLRFLHDRGIVTVLLADAVPAVPLRRLSGLTEPLEQWQIDALLEACDRSAPAGRRDFAVITMLRRLGLRCGEVANLRLEDIDWRGGVVEIHGKGDRVDRFPLPVDVGAALVDYLRQGRPATSARTVFVKAVAPSTSLDRGSLSCIVARAADRSGLGVIHAHRLRHTTAS